MYATVTTASLAPWIVLLIGIGGGVLAAITGAWFAYRLTQRQQETEEVGKLETRVQLLEHERINEARQEAKEQDETKEWRRETSEKLSKIDTKQGRIESKIAGISAVLAIIDPRLASSLRESKREGDDV